MRTTDAPIGAVSQYIELPEDSTVKHILIAVSIVALAVPAVDAGDVTETTVFQILVSRQEKKVPPDVVILRELVTHKKITAKVRTNAAKLSAGTLFSWLTDKTEKEVHKELATLRAKVSSLDATDKDKKEKLEQIQIVVGEFRKAVVAVERSLHVHIHELLVLDGIRSKTTYGPLAQFYVKRLPRLRKALSSLANDLRKKLKTKVPKPDLEQEYSKKPKQLASIKWAWNQVKVYSELWNKQDYSKREEAKPILAWATAVVEALPQKGRTKVEVAIYGSHQSLIQTLKNYGVK